MDMFTLMLAKKSGGGGGGEIPSPTDPLYVYKTTRPPDWLPMPEPQAEEMYLLFHIPDKSSAFISFLVRSSNSEYNVELGRVQGGEFVSQSQTTVSGVYKAELLADDFGDLTSTGMKQCMIKVSGSNIQKFEVQPNSSAISGSTFPAHVNVVEISCNLPNATTIWPSYTSIVYFDCIDSNIRDAKYMFGDCNALKAVLRLKTSTITNAQRMFVNCYSLTAIPELNLPAVTTYNTNMFMKCFSLMTVPKITIPAVTSTNGMFNSCCALTAIPELNLPSATLCAFKGCYALSSLSINKNVEGWSGADIDLSDTAFGRVGLVNFFNDLPTITASHEITLTGVPGAAELTDEDKAIATGKGWTLTI